MASNLNSGPDSKPTTVSIYQHRAMSGPDRYYCDTMIPNNYGWGEGIPIFCAYLKQEEGTIPIYRHQAMSGYDRYYYDTQIPNNYGWKDGVVLCYAYATQQAGTIPIYIHYAGDPDRYFLDTQIPNNYGWSDGRILCYAYPAQSSLVNDIVGILGWQGAKYRGITYSNSDDNRFILVSTPGHWNQSSTVTLPIKACDVWLDLIRSMIALAHNIVDITLLWETSDNLFAHFKGLPQGGLQKAISEGLWMISQSGKTPLVRILIGVPPPVVVRQADLENWLKATIELNDNQKISNVRYQIIVTCTKQSPMSWNHSKIIAIDGVKAIAGGHNPWSDVYLGNYPVHDVSGYIEGSVVECAHGFCDRLWQHPSAIPSPVLLSDGQFISYTPIARPKGGAVAPIQNGNTRMLSLGRLGFGIADEFTITTNASVSARVMALCRAQKIIRISQQSLYFSIAGSGGFDFYTLWAIVKAMQNGVNVQIVVSNDVPNHYGGYLGNLQKVVDALASLYISDKLGIFKPNPDPARNNLEAWANASLKSPVSDIPLYVTNLPTNAQCAPIINELNTRLSVAPLYYAPNINYWQVGTEKIPAANHAKVYIIDDTHFYVGSDNFYLSGETHGLQEYGHLIESPEETRIFIQNYWDKIWENSSQHIQKASIPKFRVPVKIPPPDMYL